MSKVKIIHLLCHLPLFAHKNMMAEEYFDVPEKGKYHKLDYPPYWVGFFAQDHNAFAAKDFLELTDEFEIECWRPYGYGLRESHEENVNGIKHRVFPAYQKKYPQIGSITWSDELYNALIDEINKDKIILNISVGHAWFHIKLMRKIKKLKDKFGLVAIHRSGGFRSMSYSQLQFWKKLIKWYYFLESRIDADSLKQCDKYLISALPELEYIKKKKKDIPAEFFMEGVDFSKYRVLNKEEKRRLREELRLPLEKKILIAYGNWKSNDYGYQHLLEVFRSIKKTDEGNDLELVMIGGYKNQDLYQIGVESGAIMIEKVSKSTFINYLEASDFFVQAVFSWGFVLFGGFGTAMIEALACGLPVISNNIIHFPGTIEERKKLGLDMPDQASLRANIIHMKNNLSEFTECRETAIKYYDLNDTSTYLLNLYRQLSFKYFGVDTSLLNTKGL
ncbi:MAG: glycosyltransferase family 4 protein [Bacteroidota bacterium]